MNSKKVKSVTSSDFNDIYTKPKPNTEKGWEKLFKKTIDQIDNFSSSLHFWYVADFSKGVVKVGGDYEIVTPLTSKEWIGLQPWDIGKLFHPLDVSKMQAFVVFKAEFLAKKMMRKGKKLELA